MKKIKIDKCLCLLFAIVCLTLFMTSLTAFAAHTDGSTEVIAHVETIPTDSTQSDTDNTGASVPNDETKISTGGIISIFTVIALIILIILLLVIYLLNKSSKLGKT